MQLLAEPCKTLLPLFFFFVLHPTIVCANDHDLSAGIQVPGLNAPIPPGTQFGYQAGGWGKPPVNEDGEPLYGDVFGQFADEEDDEQVIIASSLIVVHC